MLAVTLAMLASVGAGVGAERRWGDDARALTGRLLDVMLFAAMPFVAFFSVAALRLTAGVGAGIVVAYVALGIVAGLAWWIGARVLRLPRPSVGALICVVVVSNTGYLGVPLVAALLEPADVGAAIAWDVTVGGPMFVVVGLGVGAAFGSRAGEGRRERLRTYLLRNPPVLAVVAGLLAPDALAPQPLVDAAHAVAVALLVPGFFALGVHLAAERGRGVLAVPPRLSAPVGVALGLRLVVAPAIVLAASALVVDLPDAYLVQAAMPSGVNTLLIAHAYGLDVPLTAAAVAWTTTVAMAVAAVASTVVG